MTADSFQRVIALFADVLSKENLERPDPRLRFSIELEFYRKDGSHYWSEHTYTLIYDQAGKPVNVLGSGRHITDRKRAEDALRESEEKFSKAFQTAPYSITITSVEEGRFIEVNDEFTSMTGYTRKEALAGSTVMLKLWENIADRQNMVSVLRSGKNVTDQEALFRTKSGKVITGLFSAQMIQLSQGPCILSSISDITERKRTEEALKFNNIILRTQQESSIDGILVVDEKGAILSSNQRFADLWSIPREVMQSKSDERVPQWVVDQLQTPDEFLYKVEHLYKVQDKTSWDEVVLKDGRIFDRYSVPMLGEGGKYYGRVWYFRDITEHKQTEEKIRALARFTSENPDAVMRVAKDGILLYVNQQGLSQLPEWHLKVGERVPYVAWEAVRECLVTSSRLALDLAHGEQVFSFLAVSVPEAGYANLYGHDVTRRRQMEKALSESEERFQLANRATFNAIWDWNLQTDALWWNENYQTLFGYPAEEIEPDIEPDIESWLNRIHPEDVDRVKASIHAAIASGKDYWFDQYRLPRKDGVYADVEDRGYIARDASGHPVRMIGAMQDISECKRLGAYAEMSREVLQILNEPAELQDSIQRVIATIMARTGFDAVGIRLQDGEDYPYIAQKGFVNDFLLTENSLLEPDADGGVCRDEDGNARLACTCGLVISGKTDPANPFLTPGGSSWTNDSLPILDIPTGEDPRFHPRNNCIYQGYASIALVPIRSKDKIVGLIQLNDRRKGCFTLDAIELLEGIAAHIGAALMRKKAEAALRESEEKFRAIVAQSLEGIVITDGDSRIIEWNDAQTTLSGYSREEMLGKPLWEYQFAILPEEKKTQAMRERLERSIINLEHSPTSVWMQAPQEVVVQAKEGQQKTIEISIFPIKVQNTTLWGAVSRDITKRKRAEEALRASEARFKTIFNEAPLGIALIDSLTGYVYSVNPMFAKIAGRTVEEMANVDWMSITHPDDVQGDLDHMALLIAGKISGFQMEKRYLHHDGTLVWINMTVTPIYVEDKTHPRHLCMIEDITESRQAEKALRESEERVNRTTLNEQQKRLEIEMKAAQALREKADDLARSNKELAQFAYVASHDLQEPLRMVTSYTQLLAERYAGELDERADKYIQYAVDGAKRMQTLINDLLAYSRVGTRAKPFAKTDSLELVREAILNLSKTIEESGAEVIVGDLPTVMADRTQLGQVFQNLIANAIKFKGDAPPRVEVTAQQNGGDWEFCVADNGIGIDPEFHERVFIIFQRLHERGRYAGSGMGLAICKKIVEQHGGTYLDRVRAWRRLPV